MNYRYLEGRAAMVTGGASGMGRAMALAFAAAGADVAIGSLLVNSGAATTEGELVHRPDMEALEAARAAIEGQGVRAVAMELDVSDPASIKRFHEAASAAFGKVDILANAAGITVEHGVIGHPEELWLKVFDVNIHGVFRMTREVLPGMVERRWGRIINIASTAASVGAATSAAYCASKAAVTGLTRAVAQEGAGSFVTCNSISPGWVETDFGRGWLGNIAEKQLGKAGAAYIEEQKAANPQKRMIQPEEVGALAAFLCRDEALGITGQDLTVSAGALW
ncbi:SDR family oxidoreductase [Ectothiorhodospiraceae bacterium WFHF3C12]|nr:SDR family oxidoreductase [Ectothiorhodospiraceae bacterium WFHF3C12]